MIQGNLSRLIFSFDMNEWKILLYFFPAIVLQTKMLLFLNKKINFNLFLRKYINLKVGEISSSTPSVFQFLHFLASSKKESKLEHFKLKYQNILIIKYFFPQALIDWFSLTHFTLLRFKDKTLRTHNWDLKSQGKPSRLKSVRVCLLNQGKNKSWDTQLFSPSQFGLGLGRIHLKY